MAKARIEHVFNCSPETYLEKIFFDEEYNRRLFLDELHFESWTQLSLDETDAQIKRVIDAVPTMTDLPGPLKKLAEAGVGYRETVTLDKKTGRIVVSVEPQQLKGKLTVGGQMYCEPVGEGQCTRVYDAVVDAKIFGIGGLLEKRILSDIEANYNKAAEFTNRFIAEKSL